MLLLHYKRKTAFFLIPKHLQLSCNLLQNFCVIQLMYGLNEGIISLLNTHYIKALHHDYIHTHITSSLPHPPGIILTSVWASCGADVNTSLLTTAPSPPSPLPLSSTTNRPLKGEESSHKMARSPRLSPNVKTGY